MSLVFKITNGLTIAEYVNRNMRPIADAGYTPGDSLDEWDETPPVDPPTFPISQKDD